MKHFLTFLFCLFGFVAIAQHETRLDVETQVFCMRDSVSAGDITQFYRIFYTNTGLYTDRTANLEGIYTVTGTVIPCTGEGGCGSYSYSYENVTTADTTAANTANSLAIAAISGTVEIIIDGGAPDTLNTSLNQTLRIDQPDCETIPNQIIVKVTGGTAAVAKLQ